jgi:ribonuclease VapC
VIAVDSSAIIAILRREPEADRFEDVLIGADRVVMSTASYVELGAVIDRGGSGAGGIELDEVLDSLGISLVEFTAAQARIARAAYAKFGRGSGHSAALNFGDCFAYALARDAGVPLLFKGDDFASTDIDPYGD